MTCLLCQTPEGLSINYVTLFWTISDSFPLPSGMPLCPTPYAKHNAFPDLLPPELHNLWMTPMT